MTVTFIYRYAKSKPPTPHQREALKVAAYECPATTSAMRSPV
jgi:hypothetical protein